MRSQTGETLKYAWGREAQKKKKKKVRHMKLQYKVKHEKIDEGYLVYVYTSFDAGQIKSNSQDKRQQQQKHKT